MRKALISVFSAIASMSIVSSLSYGSCGEITMTEMDWESSQIVTSVTKFIIEQGYGCKVNLVPSSTEAAILSLVETDQPDIATELWINSTPAYTKLEAEGKVKTAAKVLSDGGFEAWWIPKYLAKKYPELKTIEDVMKNPELVGGKFHNCPAGWVCRTVNDNLIKALKLSDKMEIFNHGSGETLAASIASAYENERPWFGYFWAPTAILGKYPMIEISVGPYKDEIHRCNTRGEKCETPGVSAFPSSVVVTAVTKAFADKNPPLYKLLQNVSFTNAQMGEVLTWKEENNATSNEAAVYFIRKYKSVWGTWLNKDARSKLSMLLK
ncbi:MAG: ABC transporter substrate-binding protein [Hyphomicrobiaceae bacterium]|nr:ABC transporter substrate-binding protein [Hyphomicrobiaceae bacterium]